MLKFAEIVIILADAGSLLLDNLSCMLAMLFCIGTQSALPGLAKYSTLPQPPKDH